MRHKSTCVALSSFRCVSFVFASSEWWDLRPRIAKEKDQTASGKSKRIGQEE